LCVCLAARSVPLDMRRTNPGCPDSDPRHQSAVADFLFREEPDDEEEEEEDGNRKQDDDDDDDAQDDGYSE
jgi:hypothetical protein